MDRDPRAKDFLPEPPMIAYSRTRNIKDITIRSFLPSHRKTVRPPAAGNVLTAPVAKMLCQPPPSQVAKLGRSIPSPPPSPVRTRM